MKITPIGAAGGEATGSRYSVQTTGARILVDCVHFQGGKKSDELNRPPTGPNRECNAATLTHGHLDQRGTDGRTFSYNLRLPPPRLNLRPLTST
jgi:Cft2 family RNA processing exonuclease